MMFISPRGLEGYSINFELFQHMYIYLHVTTYLKF
jgi:hypothetical protein